MPTYDYKCDSCGHAFERFHSMSAAPVRKCPQCGKNQVKRLMGTGAGLIFKGSGFYITDYRDGGYKESAKNDSAAPAADSGKSSETVSKNSEAKSTSAESKPVGATKVEKKTTTVTPSKSDG